MDRVMISIDPGVVTAGLAVWDAKTWGKKHKGRCPVPREVHTFNVRFGRSEGKTAERGAEYAVFRLAEWMKGKLKNYMVDQVWCEKMEFRSTGRGIAAIDDVMNVAFACGVFGMMAMNMGAGFHPAPVSLWKGQLSKTQVARRILKRWGLDKCERPEVLLDMVEGIGLSDPEHPSHDWDAVGIGLYGQRLF